MGRGAQPNFAAARARSGAAGRGHRLAPRQRASGRQFRRRCRRHRQPNGPALGQGAWPATQDHRALRPARRGECVVWRPMLLRLSCAVWAADRGRLQQPASLVRSRSRAPHGILRRRSCAAEGATALVRPDRACLLDGAAHRAGTGARLHARSPSASSREFAATSAIAGLRAVARRLTRARCRAGCGATPCWQWPSC